MFLRAKDEGGTSCTLVLNGNGPFSEYCRHGARNFVAASPHRAAKIWGSQRLLNAELRLYAGTVPPGSFSV
jgi:anthranilate/para-aminobenzoate synthase component I